MNTYKERRAAFEALTYLKDIPILDLEDMRGHTVSSILPIVAEAVAHQRVSEFFHLFKSATVRQYIHLTPCINEQNILWESLRHCAEVTKNLIELPNIKELANAHDNEALKYCCSLGLIDFAKYLLKIDNVTQDISSIIAIFIDFLKREYFDTCADKIRNLYLAMMAVPGFAANAHAHNNEILCLLSRIRSSQQTTSHNRTLFTESLILQLLDLKNISHNSEAGVVQGLIWSFAAICGRGMARPAQKMLTSTILLEHIALHPNRGLEAINYACEHGLHNVFTALMNTEIARLVDFNTLTLAITNKNTDIALELLALPQIQAHAHEMMGDGRSHLLMCAYALDLSPVVASLASIPAVATRVRDYKHALLIMEQWPCVSANTLEPLLDIVVQNTGNALIPPAPEQEYKELLQRILELFVRFNNNAAVQRILTVNALLECDLSTHFLEACKRRREDIAFQLLPHIIHGHLAAIYFPSLAHALNSMPRLAGELLSMHDLLPIDYSYNGPILGSNAAIEKQQAADYITYINQFIMAPCMLNRTTELLAQLCKAADLAELPPALAKTLLNLPGINADNNKFMYMKFISNAIIFGHEDFAITELRSLIKKLINISNQEIEELFALSIRYNRRLMLNELINIFVTNELSLAVEQGILGEIKNAVNNKHIDMITKQIMPLANKFDNLQIQSAALYAACLDNNKELAMHLLSFTQQTMTVHHNNFNHMYDASPTMKKYKEVLNMKWWNPNGRRPNGCHDVWQALWKAYEMNMHRLFAAMCTIQPIYEYISMTDTWTIAYKIDVNNSYGKNQSIEQVLRHANTPEMVRNILSDLQCTLRVPEHRYKSVVSTFIRLLTIPQVRDYISNHSADFVSIVSSKHQIFLAVARDLINMQSLSETYRTRVHKVCNAFDQPLKRCLAAIEQPSTNLLDQIPYLGGIDKIVAFLGLEYTVSNVAIREDSRQLMLTSALMPTLSRTTSTLTKDIIAAEVEHARLNCELHAYAMHLHLTKAKHSQQTEVEQQANANNLSHSCV